MFVNKRRATYFICHLILQSLVNWGMKMAVFFTCRKQHSHSKHACESSNWCLLLLSLPLPLSPFPLSLPPSPFLPSPLLTYFLLPSLPQSLSVCRCKRVSLFVFVLLIYSISCSCLILINITAHCNLVVCTIS